MFYAILLTLIVEVLTQTAGQFAILPSSLDLSNTMVSAAATASATDAQNCVDLALAEEPTAVALLFDSATGECQYATALTGIYLRDVAQVNPEFYIRIDGYMQIADETVCLTRQDAEYLVVQYVYADSECPEGQLNASSKLCNVVSGTDYGEYNTGDEPGQSLILSKSLALESVNYKCDDDSDPKMIFGGTWYCFPGLAVEAGQASADLIINNYCADMIPGSNVVKVSGELREYDYLYWWWSSKTIYLGLYLQSGTTYVWYDGSPADNVPWTPGCPTGGSANLAYVTSDYTVEDADASAMEVLVCKKAATQSPYDPSQKFI